MDPQLRTTLMGLIASAAEGGREEARELQKWPFSISETAHAAVVRAQLREQLRASKGQIADLLKLFDVDADTCNTIDLLEFNNAMKRRFGFKGSFLVVEEVFKSLDVNRNGLIGYDELVRGRASDNATRFKRWCVWLRVPCPTILGEIDS